MEFERGPAAGPTVWRAVFDRPRGRHHRDVRRACGDDESFHSTRLARNHGHSHFGWYADSAWVAQSADRALRSPRGNARWPSITIHGSVAASIEALAGCAHWCAV